jgi:predicted Holliday junction resolvase-like endonuclease
MNYIIATIILISLLYALYVLFKKDNSLKLRVELEKLREANEDLKLGLRDAQKQLETEKERNREVLSQKKSSEVRLGFAAEQLVPFLSVCPFNASDLRFLGSPIDLVAFDLDAGEITFIEVKTNNSKLSKRQKIIKNIIKQGRVNYAEIRVDTKGAKFKKLVDIKEPMKEEKEDGQD